MHTPFFPAWRSRLAALGRRTARAVRQTTLAQLQEHLRDFLPAPLLSRRGRRPQQPGANLQPAPDLRVLPLASRSNPNTSCREVVRHVQALFARTAGASSMRATRLTCRPASACPENAWNKP